MFIKKILVINSALLVLIFLAGCGLQTVRQTQPITPVSETQQPAQPNKNQQSIPQTANQAVNWKKYTDTVFGYSFYYPSSWTVTVDEDSVLITNFGDPVDHMTIKKVTGDRVTVEDAKFGNTILYYDNNTKQWMKKAPNERGDYSSFIPVTPTNTMSGLPIFNSTGRWATKIVALSYNNFLVINISGGGDIKPLAPFVYTITQLNAEIPEEVISSAVQAEEANDAL